MSPDTEPEGVTEDGAGLDLPVGRTQIIAALIFVAVAFSVIGVVLLATMGGNSEGGDGSAGAVTAAPASQTATLVPVATGVIFSPQDADDEALVNLAQKSIDILPLNEWPTLYTDFTQEFRDRCALADFEQAGKDGAEALGADLPLLAFKQLQDVQINGDTATGVIVGEIKGKSEYSVTVAYQRVDGVWKLAPAPGTSGCSAFNRLSG
jgi:hypothetical protein